MWCESRGGCGVRTEVGVVGEQRLGGVCEQRWMITAHDFCYYNTLTSSLGTMM